MSTDEHDPMRLLAELGAKPVPPPNPWESLARTARSLAETADHYATLDPAALAPSEDPDGDEARDPLSELTVTALALQSIVAVCRRATYQALVARGMTPGEIAELWGGKAPAVRKVLRGPK